MATPVVQEVYTYQLTGNTTTISHTVRDGANRYMLIDLPGRFASLTSAAYGGTAAPAIPGADAGAGSAGTTHRHVSAAGLVAPPVGTASLVIVVSGNNQGTVRVRNMVDVDQSTPLRSQGGGNYAVSSSGTSSTGDTLSVAAQAGDLVMDLIAVSTTATMGAGQTRTGYGTQPSNQYASAKVATGASESMGWTYSSATFAHLGLAVIGAAATQPAPADYTGGRGTRSWHVAARLSGEEVTAGSTFYGSLSASVETSTAESTLVRTLMREAGELSRLTCGILTNATTSASTLTLLEGGVSTGITITIPAGATGLFEAAGAHTLSGSTALGWSLANGGGGSIYINRLTWAFEAASGDTVTHLSAFSSSSWDVPSNTTAYMSAQGSRLSGSTVESYAAMRVPMDATWRGLHVIANNREDVTVVSRINGNNGNQTLSWATAGGIWNPQEDTTHSDAIVDGDLIDWRVITGTLGAVWQNERWSSRLISTASEFLLAARAGPSSTGVALSDGVWYAPVSGELSLSSTEADAQAPAPFDMASKRLAVHVTSNTSLLPCKVSLRINGADASQRIEIQPGIAGVFYADVWGVDNIDTDDLVCVKFDNAGATNTIRVVSISLVGIERVASLPAIVLAAGGGLLFKSAPAAGDSKLFLTPSNGIAAKVSAGAGDKRVSLSGGNWLAS
jgi:hypothetical protein